MGYCHSKVFCGFSNVEDVDILHYAGYGNSLIYGGCVMKVERTHDYFYLNENYKEKPKEYFKFIEKEIAKDFKQDTFKMVDIGCETGSFLFFLRSLHANAELIGMDILPELLERVNTEQNMKTVLGDISNAGTYKDKMTELKDCDFVTMLSVLSIFDDFKPIIQNALQFLKENGILYIFGFFNPENLDIIIRSKYADRKCDWERGWNYFSIYSLKKWCDEIGCDVEFIPFHIGIDIPKHDNDPLRSWTVNIGDGEKMILNGLQLVHHLYLVKIKNSVSGNS